MSLLFQLPALSSADPGQAWHGGAGGRQHERTQAAEVNPDDSGWPRCDRFGHMDHPTAPDHCFYCDKKL